MAGDTAGFHLEVGVFPIRQATFAVRTDYANGTLAIDRPAMLAVVAEPRIIADIDIQLAHPGESCRIVHVLDALCPMVKIHGRSTVYPGFLGTTMPAGNGRTHQLQGLAIVVCGTFPDATSGALSPVEAIIDMSGPAAPYCAFSDTVNVVVVCHPAAGISSGH